MNKALRNNTYRNRASTKCVNEVKREALLQNIRNSNNSILNNTNMTNNSYINDEQKPQINSIHSIVVTTNKNGMNPSNLSTSQISNFSNLNITNNKAINNSMINPINPQFGNMMNCDNIEVKISESIPADEKMQIDEDIQTRELNGTLKPTKVESSFNNNKDSSLIQANCTTETYSKIPDIFSLNNNNVKRVNSGENLKYGSTQVLNPTPQLVDEYLTEIFAYLKEIEFNIVTNAFYMKNQTDVNEKMRAILIDWLVEVHLKFKLVPETLFLTVNLIDRYLDKKVIMRNRLQLVGVTAMLIACKYEEIYAPEVRDFVYITDKAYTKDEIFQMESDMLSTLEYNITVPSSYRYMEVFNRYLKLEENAIFFCRYLLELFLVDYKMLKYNPSLLAAATMFITLKITKKSEADKVVELTGYSDETLKECAKDICNILDNVEKNSLQAVRKKFSLPKFMEVAKIKFN